MNEDIPVRIYDVETKEFIDFDSRKKAAKHYMVRTQSIQQSIATKWRFSSSVSGSLRKYAARNVPPLS